MDVFINVSKCKLFKEFSHKRMCSVILNNRKSPDEGINNVSNDIASAHLSYLIVLDAPQIG